MERCNDAAPGREWPGPRKRAVVLILLADADPDEGRLIRGFLRGEGHTVEWVRSGGEAIQNLRQAALDVLIMATRLPDVAGLEVCRKIRTESALPIVLLGSAGDPADCVMGLEVGADVYLAPPISPRELGARVRAIHRRALRSSTEPDGEDLVLGDLRVRPAEFRATLRGQVLELQPQEYRLLLAFAQRPGVVLSRERLLELGWNRAVNAATVGVHLAWIRRKLRGSNVRIENVRQRGYRLMVGGEFGVPD